MQGKAPIRAIVRRTAAVLLFSGIAAASFSNAIREMDAGRSPAARSTNALKAVIVNNNDADQIDAKARRIALNDPLHAVGFYLRALALEKRGNVAPGDAEAGMRLARHRQPAFVAPHLWLIAHEHRRGNYADVVRDSDLVLRINGDYRKLLIPVLLPLLDNPKSSKILSERLMRYPVWRSEFMAQAIDRRVADQRLEALISRDPPPAYRASLTDERSRYLSRLMKDGSGEKAYGLWRRFVGSNARATPIFDGEFAVDVQILPFGWSLRNDGVNYAERVAAADSNMLRVHHGGSGSGAIVEQILMMKPARWRITIEQRSGGLADPASLEWSVSCAGDGRILATLPLDGLKEEWAAQRLDVAPTADCPLQRLRLAGRPAGDNAEAEIEIRHVRADRL